MSVVDVVLRPTRVLAGTGARLKRALRPMVVVPLVAIAAAGGWYAARTSKPATGATSTITRTAVATTGTMRQTVAASGTLSPSATDDLNFAVSGQVTAVNVKAGQAVTKGALLATIDSAALQSQVAQAQAVVDSAAARLASDQSSGASTAQVNADQADLTASDASLASAQTSLAGTTLTSPIDGTVASVNLTVGQQLGSTGTSGSSLTGTATGSGRTSAPSASSSSGTGTGASSTASSSTAQIQVISTGSYVVNLSVDDTQIGRIATGQPATVTPSTASSTPADGTVTSVGTMASTSSGVASFPVVVGVTGNPAGFFPGATVQVAITYQQLDNVLQVPSAAITQSNGQSFVMITQNGKKVQRAVATGLVSGGQTQITSGLSAGDQVTITVTTRAVTGSNTNTGNNFRNGGGGFVPGGAGGGPPGGFRGAGG